MDNEIKTKLLEYVENTAAFLGEQVPEVFEQILKYQFFSNIFACLISLIICIGVPIILIKLFKRFWNSDNERNSDNEPLLVLASVFGVAFFILGFVYFTRCADGILKIYLAPKLYLLDYLRGS